MHVGVWMGVNAGWCVRGWRRELVCIDGDAGSLVCVEWRRLIGCGLRGGRGVIAVGSWWAPMRVLVWSRGDSEWLLMGTGGACGGLVAQWTRGVGYGSRWGDWLGVCADGRVECW